MAAIIRIKENFPWSLLLERWRSKYGDFVRMYFPPSVCQNNLKQDIF